MISIEGAIKPLTYTLKKRKLIRTYIYNIFYVLTIFKNVMVGYSGEQEKEARCKRFDRKHLPSVVFEENSAVERPTLSFILEVIQELNRVCLVKKALNSNIGLYGYDYGDKEKNCKILINMVHINGFKSVIKDFTRASVFTFDSYKKYVFSKMKMPKAKAPKNLNSRNTT